MAGPFERSGMGLSGCRDRCGPRAMQRSRGARAERGAGSVREPSAGRAGCDAAFRGADGFSKATFALQFRSVRADLVQELSLHMHVRGAGVIVTCKATRPATDLQVAATVSEVLQQRASTLHAPVTLAIPDAVAL